MALILNWFHQVLAMATRFFFCPVIRFATPKKMTKPWMSWDQHREAASSPCNRIWSIGLKILRKHRTPPLLERQ